MDSHGDNAGDFIEDKVTPAPADAVTLTILREKIEELLDVLTPREKDVLWRRFGLEDGKEWTLNDIGKTFNLTRERIRQIESQAFGKLREPAQIQQLNDFIG